MKHRQLCRQHLRTELRTQRAGWQNAATMAAELAEKETDTRAGLEEEAPAGPTQETALSAQ